MGRSVDELTQLVFCMENVSSKQSFVKKIIKIKVFLLSIKSDKAIFVIFKNFDPDFGTLVNELSQI